MYDVIINEHAGSGRAARAGELVRQTLSSLGIEYRVHYTQCPGHASALAQKAMDEGAERIIAVGGDGTAMEAAQPLAGTGVILGIIPAGTGNDFARMLGISSDIGLATRQAVLSAAKRVDAIRVGDRLFLNVASFGMDIDVVRNTERFKRIVRGMAAYMLGIFASLVARRTTRVDISFDGGPYESREALMVVIGNCQYYGGGIRVLPMASPYDGFMDVMVVEKITRLKIISLLARFVKGRHTDLPICTFKRCHIMDVHPAGQLEINMDGDLIMFSESRRLELLPGALCVSVPSGEE